MHQCRCSVRALEIFVQDFAGLAIKRQPSRFLPSRQQAFSARAAYRQLETRPASVAQHDDSLVVLKRKDEHIRAMEELKPELQELRARELDEAWSSKAAVVTPESEGEGKYEQFSSAEDVEMQSEDAAGKKMKRLERKKKRQAEGAWAPVKRENEVRKRDGFVIDVEGTVEDSAERFTAPTRAEKEATTPRTRKERRNAMASKDGSRTTRDTKPRKVSEVEGVRGKASEAKQPKPRTKEAVEAKTRSKQSSKMTAKADRDSKTTSRPKPTEKESWRIQKASLERKFGEQGWQPKKRLSPDTLEGIRALHVSDPGNYNTETLAKHFQITPEAIRRILKSKWRPNEEEAEDRRQRWEKRGVKKWTEMAELGVRPPSKWRALGVSSKEQLKKRVKDKQGKPRKDVPWKSRREEAHDAESFAGRIL